MFIEIILVLFLISFLMALRSLKTINDKPGIKDVKKSLDKNKIIYRSQSSSE